MCRFDVPCCSVCYEYLTSNLCVLSVCGHVYHRECLARWTNRKVNQYPGCPLCRADIPRTGILDLKFECTERRSDSVTQDGDADISDQATQLELDDVKQRLSQAVADKMDLQEQCSALENDNASLEKALLLLQDTNNGLETENKDLKLAAAANKTRISKLADMVEKQKEQLSKLEYASQYLISDKSNVEAAKNYLEALSPTEQLNLLNNRITELESMNQTLSELRDGWKRKCEKLSSDYLTLEREHAELFMRLQPNTHNQHLPDPLSEAPSPNRTRRPPDKDIDEPRKVARSIDFGFMRKSNMALNVPQKRPQPSPFGITNTAVTAKSVKAKPQNIVKFFKAQ